MKADNSPINAAVCSQSNEGFDHHYLRLTAYHSTSRAQTNSLRTIAKTFREHEHESHLILRLNPKSNHSYFHRKPYTNICIHHMMKTGRSDFGQEVNQKRDE
ncbi:Uncharacterized protein Fot_14558 [Forsythia ovata]|uniref:Uncharacterized protein n=1 Tax=Forsythia ovata TaxID=205694 RepID=A0ABD1W6N8_9LAMI